MRSERRPTRTRRADQIVQHFASQGNTEPIPGAVGGLPTITGNGGLATLYRAVRDKDNVNPFLTQEDALKAATKSKLDAMAGGSTPEEAQATLDAAVKNRADTVKPMYDQAWANKTAADPSGAIQTVDDLMQSPLKQNDTAMAELANIKKKLLGADGTGETDPEQLKGITDSIDATVQRLSTEGKADIGTRRALAQVDTAITGTISPAAPGFDAAQVTYANLSKRIDEMKYFQSRKLTDLQGNPTLGNIRSTLDDIRKKQAGDKFNPADSVTPENLQTLQQLHDQTQREAFTAAGGKSLGGSNVSEFGDGQHHASLENRSGRIYSASEAAIWRISLRAAAARRARSVAPLWGMPCKGLPRFGRHKQRPVRRLDNKC